ncbi:MAG: UDP-N-acetylglucosamine--N-acetylmuramyl-(pentapeptide) pyrophosphoryl-undecaprenol N-acetylglucosamine transferase [Phycisphaerae bacterium]|nr:UDP-N-acetylglucosamine--N-acetylmuramyl-(pentapeptide) pyrophosphoryl-undecaprenol N-acetylglucosamine transferase [Phycisphaerae bacterium]
MSSKAFIFAGGGTGGHIYPGLAVAEKLRQLAPEANIHFFCSDRPIDSQILTGSGFAFTPLPAKAFSLHPKRLWELLRSLRANCSAAKEKFGEYKNAQVIGIGGFVAVPVCWSAKRAGIGYSLINVDIVPGKANKLLSRWAKRVFVQFEDTREYFKKSDVVAAGCPLREQFQNPMPQRVIETLGLDADKKILLITGASSGAVRVNEAILGLKTQLDDFAEGWQVVHLAGKRNFEAVKAGWEGAKIEVRVLDYWDEMADLLSAADIVIGRSGAVSVSEYATCGVPSICMPYPYHKDRHQYRNAGKLVDVGAAVIVDDLADQQDRQEWLWEELSILLKDNDLRNEMKDNCRLAAKPDAAARIAQMLLTDA